jgi:hypothetical protein
MPAISAARSVRSIASFKSVLPTLALPALIHRQARQQHDGNRMARKSLGQALGCFLAHYMTHGKRVATDDGIAGKSDIGLRRACLLVIGVT